MGRLTVPFKTTMINQLWLSISRSWLQHSWQWLLVHIAVIDMYIAIKILEKVKTKQCHSRAALNPWPAWDWFHPFIIEHIFIHLPSCTDYTVPVHIDRYTCQYESSRTCKVVNVDRQGSFTRPTASNKGVIPVFPCLNSWAIPVFADCCFRGVRGGGRSSCFIRCKEWWARVVKCTHRDHHLICFCFVFVREWWLMKGGFWWWVNRFLFFGGRCFLFNKL